MRYVLKLEDQAGRVMTNPGNGTSDWPVAAGEEAIAPTLEIAQAMVATGNWSWVEGMPPEEEG